MVNIPDKDPMGHGFGNSVMLQVAPFQAPAKHIHTLKTGCGLGRFRSRFQRWPTGRLSWQTVEVRSMGTYIHHHASNGINVWKHMWIHIYIYHILFWNIWKTENVDKSKGFKRQWATASQTPPTSNFMSSLPPTKKVCCWFSKYYGWIWSSFSRFHQCRFPWK